MKFDYSHYFTLIQDPAAPYFGKLLKGVAHHAPCREMLTSDKTGEIKGYICKTCGESGWLSPVPQDKETGAPLL